jgi:hypothetical protein
MKKRREKNENVSDHFSFYYNILKQTNLCWKKKVVKVINSLSVNI